MKFITDVIDLVSVVSSMSPMLGVHVRTGGRMGQGATAEQFNLTGVPSSTSSLDGVRLGLGGESEESKQCEGGRVCKIWLHMCKCSGT